MAATGKLSGTHGGGRRASVSAFATVMCLTAVLLPVVVIATTGSPAAAATVHAEVPRCPPDCGDVASGDPLLVPFMTQNPGAIWQAFPASDSKSYVNALRRNIDRLGGHSTTTNIAAARWDSAAGGYSLLITLVSSTSLASVHLQNPLADASDMCASAGGRPTGAPYRIPGIPNSVAGSCAFSSKAPLEGADVVAYVRANVAVLIEIGSQSRTGLKPLLAAPAAHEQYAALPQEGVPISKGGLDLGWVILWVCILAGLGVCVVLCVRRRGSWKGPFVSIAEAVGRRRVGLGVSAAAVVGAMAFTMLESTVTRGFGEWWGVASFGDFWQNWADAANLTVSGGYGHLYVLDRTLETAPAFQTIIAPVARLAFGLPFPYPSAVLYPAAFWVAGPLYLGAIALPICACDRWMNGMGITHIRRRLFVLGVMAITLPPIPLSGHPEDLVALGAMLYGIAAAFEGRARATGWWLGVALAFQPFAFLAIPIAFIFLKRREWLRALGPVVAVPLAFLLVPLIVEPRVTVSQLLHQQVYDVFGYISPTWNLNPGVAAYFRSGVALAAIPAAFVLARFLPSSKRRGAALVIWTVALLFSLRVVEPELFPYFMAPTLALLPVSAASLPWWRLGAASALAVWLTWWLHVAIKGEWSLWLILVSQLLVLSWLAFPGRPDRNNDTDQKTQHAAPGKAQRDRALVNR
ncbi:MAG: hypothetical protein WAM97_17840 [Acidimicrobiales bacterium]